MEGLQLGIPLRALIIEDNEDDAMLVIRVLQKGGFDPTYERVETAEAMRSAIGRGTWDIILSDYSMPHFSGAAALQLYKHAGLEIPFIIVSGTIGDEAAVAAMVAGAHDYLMKNSLARLVPAVQRELKEAESRKERKAALVALEQYAEEIGDLYHNAPCGYHSLGPDGTFLRINDTELTWLGYGRDELVGKKKWIDLLPPEGRQVFQEAFSVFKQKGWINNLEFDLVRKDGTILPVLLNATAVADADGNFVMSRGTIYDYTERKEAAKQLERTLESLRKAFDTIIQVMVSAVEARDPYTSGHQTRSADLAVAIAAEMGLPQEQIDGIRMAGSIHDIGKLSVPAELLSKPTRLSALEFALIKEHALSGYEILKDVVSPWPLAQIVYQHHERMNGTGYPRNLKGDEILMEARIMAVADVVEAMGSHRPYRPSLGVDAALAEIEQDRGTLYDSAVADACLTLFRKKGYRLDGS
jgi:PAS domain S-box-containing protein